MARYTIQAPDGHMVTLDGPPGASRDQVIQMAQQLYRPGGGQPPPAQPTPAQPPNNDGAINGLNDLGSFGNMLQAGVVNAAHQVPLVGDAAMTASRMAGDAMRGNPVSWGQANSEVHTILDSAQQTHPIASTVGGVGGAVLSAAGAGAAIKAASAGEPLLAALPRATTLAQRAANAGRLAVAGGLAGGAQGAAQRGGEQLAADNPQAAPAAATQGAEQGGVAGAVLGPVGAGVVTTGARAMAPLAGKTALALSRVFGESAADLQTAWQTFTASTGRAPTMAELMSLKQQGQLAGAARNSGTITTALRQAADDAARARSGNMQSVLAPPQGAAPTAPLAAPSQAGASSSEIGNAKSSQGDLDFGAVRSHSFNVPGAKTYGEDDSTPYALAAAALSRLPAGLARSNIAAELESGQLSGNSVDLLRKNLTKLDGAKPGEGYGELRDDLLGALAGAPGNEAGGAALNTARANFATNAQRQAGAAHGESILGSDSAANFTAEAGSKVNSTPSFQTGLASGARSRLADQAAAPQDAESLVRSLASDDSLHAKLVTSFGQGPADALRRLGQSETSAAQNLAPYRSRMAPADDQDASDAKTFLTAVAAAHSPIGGPIYKAIHLTQMGLGLRMSGPVQEKVAEYLSDPKMVSAGINLLRKAGATNAQLRQLAIGAAQSSGVIGASVVNNASEPQQ